jgi:type IV secretory pathway TrbF-like protein
MLRLDKVIKSWKEAASLNDYINLYGFWNETAFLTKSGDVGMVLNVPGVDYESLDYAGQEYAVKRLEAALKAFGPGFHLYQYLFKSNRPEIPFAKYDNPVVDAAILVLAAVCLTLAGLIFKSQRALAAIHPLIVRINDIGRAEAIDYRNFQYRPREAENKYYLSRWTELYFSRNRFTVERDQTSALYFLNSDVQRAVIEQERKDKIIQSYVKDSSLPFVDIDIKSVILDDLRQSPYSARIEFEKVYTNPADHSELKRERWAASVTYVFRENVKNNELAVNPLGLTIVRFRADQAFS